MRYLLYITTYLLFLSFVACGSGDKSVAVPRQEAYPRIALYDTIYKELSDAPVRFQVNAACSISSERAGWYNVSYPAYGGIVYLTFTETTEKELPAMLDNRMERIDLNLGGNPAERNVIEGDQFDALLVKSAQTRQMPLQFIATDNKKLLISGAFFMPDVAADAPIDSLRPVVEAVSRDLIHSLKQLSNNVN